ncbi:hypothetical protein NB688_000585 [Xanthomonas sacchari]|uniref:Uncharacterized protein n=1 Tax=Xanthomonas sacchari TaxID=56458 RepID=A0ABT3DTF1_9XANT|nr:hypothetical protein [Xanthomonas sacchari]MCW0398771.1 hypothetical protein [Xanthomonas sacchari]MCW0418419.1 hypothetical protein [Xanthomonas sacchari]UYK72518.1 hypothetical protein NG828_20415 [Xanthomonas sacchari]
MDSPRELLRAAVAANLRRIREEDGYRTDAGAAVTLEPGQVDDSADAVLTPVVLKQERGQDAAVAKTHRLTKLGVLAKVPASLGEAQARLDAIVSDVEQAMADRQSSYPPGIQFPVYVSMEPVKPEAGMGWTGALITYQSHIPIK